MSKRAYWETRIGPDRHFTPRAVARIVGRSPRTVQRWIRQGRIPALGGSDHTTGHLRVLREDLIDFLLRLDSAVTR